MTMDLSKYLDMYVTQTKEDVDAFADRLLVIENNPEDDDAINTAFRLAHTIKGNAATMMFTRTAELAHVMETLLDAVRSHIIGINQEVMDLFFRCADTLEMMIEAARQQKPEPDVSSLISQIRERIPTEEEKTEEPTPKKGKKAQKKEDIKEKPVKEKRDKKEERKVTGIKIELSPDCKMFSARAFIAIRRLETAGRIVDLDPPREMIESEKFDGLFTVWLETTEDAEKLANDISRLKDVIGVTLETGGPVEAAEELVPGPVAVRRDVREIRSVRVKMDRLDDLLDSVGELVIAKIRLADIDRSIKNRELNEAILALDRLASELQYNVLRIRMVPIEVVFSKFPRMVRDLSQKMNKEIDLIIEGNEIELDRSVIDKLGDLLVHLLRNSIDHGIETPDKRKKARKRSAGTIRLSASQQQNSVIITVEDDGKGIDIDKVKKKALEKNMHTEEELEIMSDDEVIGLLARPGFSTADEVTTVSGRGVGLDAVKMGIEMLGGQMEIESTKDRGVRIVIRMPLTLAIILVMMVRIKNEIYAIPVDPIIETISINIADIKTIGGMKVINFRGEIVPLIYLSQELHIDEMPMGSEAVIVNIGQNKAGLVVEELMGQQEIVVKPLDRHLRNIACFGGATILGSGEVALIIDVTGLLVGHSVSRGKIEREETPEIADGATNA